MLKPGTIVSGKYRLLHLIAEGGMAEVYLAERIPVGSAKKLFAIKRLLPKLSAHAIFAELFAYEASLTASFKHENIVVCHEFVREKDDLFMVMDFIIGKDLGALMGALKDYSLRERTNIAILVGLEVSRALIYIHDFLVADGRAGLVHGDISPQNLMISVEGKVKIYDFGAAKACTNELLICDEVVRGNLRYMSPEQIAGVPIDARSDVFSLSLVLLELIFSHTPDFKPGFFNSCEPSDRKRAIAALPHVSPELRDFFIQGLGDTQERFFSRDMAARLLGIAQHLELKDGEIQLREFISKAQSTPDSKPVKKSRDRSQPFIYFSLVSLALGLFLWISLTVFTDLFEPKYRHNFPHWPTPALEEVEAAEQKNEEILPEKMNEPKKISVKKTGSLYLAIQPWAEVYINGKFYGSTPMKGIELPQGQYLVQLRNPDMSAVALKIVKIYADRRTELIHRF